MLATPKPDKSHVNISRPAGPDAPSALMVFVLGLLMSGSFGVRFAEFPLWVSLSWFLPLLAAWLAHRHGLQVLRAWWPLAFIPSIGFNSEVNGWGGLGVQGIWFELSTSTWLLALFVAAAVDQHVAIRPIEQW